MNSKQSKSNIVVIIPYYKKSNYIGDCLKSIELASEYANIITPVIIMDDGSPTDKFVDVDIESMNLSHLLINAYYQKNSKASRARVNSIRYAIIEHGCDGYIMQVDPDDTITKDAFVQIMNYTNKYPDVDVFITQLMKYDEGILMPYQHYNHRDWNHPVIGKTIKCIYDNLIYCNHSVNVKIAKTIRWKEALDNNISMRINSGDDLYISSRLYLKCNTMMYTDINHYIYRYLPTGITHDTSSEASIDNMHAINIAKFLRAMKGELRNE